MGNLFGGAKKPVWVPVNEKLEEKIRDPAQWQIFEDLSGWKVCNDGAKLGPALKEAKTATVNLSFNGLGDDEAIKIAGALEGNKCVAKINLANNFIHKAGMKKIAEVLSNSEPAKRARLEELDLRNNCAGPEGATALAGMLSANKNLKVVNLQWNGIGNTGLYA